MFVYHVRDFVLKKMYPKLINPMNKVIP